MSAVHDVVARRDQLVSAVTRDVRAARLESAQARLLDLVNDFGSQDDRHEANVLAGRISRVTVDRRRNLLQDDAYDVALDRIARDLLSLADGVGGSPSESRAGIEEVGVGTRRPRHLAPVPSPTEHEQGPAHERRVSLRDAMQQFTTQTSRDVPSTVLECLDATTRYRRSNFELSRINFELSAGEILGVIGVNGSGKTTLVRHLAGELSPSSGQIRYPALTVESHDWRALRDQIGFVPQFPARWHGRLNTNLSLFTALRGHRGVDNQINTEFWLHRLRLYEHRERTWNEISGGLRVRFELARALLSAPKLLVLDEPLAHLDVITQQLFLDDLREITHYVRSPLAAVISSQHLHEVERVADRILFLDDGMQRFYGRSHDVRKDRPTALFEISGPFDEQQLRLATSRLNGRISVHRVGTTFFVRADKETRMTDVLRHISDAGLPASYIRDLSESTARLILEPAAESHE